jgi:hypothetical protein
VRALRAFLERLLYPINLAAYPADSIQKLVLVSNDVCHLTLPLPTIIYPGRYIVQTKSPRSIREVARSSGLLAR